MSIFIDYKGDWWRFADKDTKELTGPEIRGSRLMFSTTTPQKKAKPQVKKARKIA